MRSPSGRVRTERSNASSKSSQLLRRRINLTAILSLCGTHSARSSIQNSSRLFTSTMSQEPELERSPVTTPAPEAAAAEPSTTTAIPAVANADAPVAADATAAASAPAAVAAANAHAATPELDDTALPPNAASILPRLRKKAFKFSCTNSSLSRALHSSTARARCSHSLSQHAPCVVSCCSSSLVWACYAAYAREDHGKAIYCVTFCDILPAYERIFAAVGGNRVREAPVPSDIATDIASRTTRLLACDRSRSTSASRTAVST